MSKSPRRIASSADGVQPSAGKHDIPQVGGSFILHPGGAVTPADAATAARMNPAEPETIDQPPAAAEEA